MGDSHVGLQARLMSQALRKLAGTLNRTDTICLFTNQLREKIGVMFGNPETTPGGRALKFYSSVRLDIRRIETLKEGVEAFGNRVRVKVVKNKVAPPFKQAEFDIIYGTGISWEGTVLDAGIERKVVAKSGSYFSFGDERLGQGRQNATAFLREHPDVTQQILQQIQLELGPEQVVSARLLPVAPTADEAAAAQNEAAADEAARNGRQRKAAAAAAAAAVAGGDEDTAARKSTRRSLRCTSGRGDASRSSSTASPGGCCRPTRSFVPGSPSGACSTGRRRAPLARELRRANALGVAVRALRHRDRSRRPARGAAGTAGVREPMHGSRPSSTLERAGLVDDGGSRARGRPRSPSEASATRRSGTAWSRRASTRAPSRRRSRRSSPSRSGRAPLIERRGAGTKTARWLAGRGFDEATVAEPRRARDTDLRRDPPGARIRRALHPTFCLHTALFRNR